jgi:hypothetical protein
MTTRTHRRNRRISFASQAETLPLLRAAATRMGPGEVLVALLDGHRRLVELVGSRARRHPGAVVTLIACSCPTRMLR